MLTTDDLRKKYFNSEDHPYRKYENKIVSVLRSDDTILDAGCGRTAPILRKFVGKAKILIGVDLEDSTEPLPGIRYCKGDISSIKVPDNSIDVVISRAVLEHVIDPNAVFEEINRILKPSGRFIFLVPNLGDYVAILSLLIPNKFHKYIVSKTEGRAMEDVFPAYYKANTYSSIQKLCKSHGFEIVEFQWLGQYPASFMFSSVLFMIATLYEKIISKYECLGFLRGWLLVELKKIKA
ncbi:class I SAM-dependent methyltransferase [Candidatus Nitrospira neomarina]|uniref:Methyltransferase domain-containing protein n=1 Tax=Candidatus Nitrospira neomarina TaxID=3020899 RepID=A0AA96JYA5_9BACT|nr:methyltransferase domain-containing protein [Candidatus Nitrospira neomarina]WNM63975.1 methyltransferase domain-containing protein [Candidatus Nitrospira neomarina]